LGRSGKEKRSSALFAKIEKNRRGKGATRRGGGGNFPPKRIRRSLWERILRKNVKMNHLWQGEWTEIGPKKGKEKIKREYVV